jgi:hypothetical protein
MTRTFSPVLGWSRSRLFTRGRFSPPPTPAHHDQVAIPTRTLTTEVWYPAEAGDASQAYRDLPSMGGLTTALVGLHPAVSDPRLHALIPTAPATCTLGVEVFDAPNPPMLVVHGDGDAILDFDEQALPLFERSKGPRWLARLSGGTHTGFPDVTAGLFDGLDHADSVGCSQIEDAISGGELPDVDPVDGVGGVIDSGCTAPCTDLEGYGLGMKPTRQVDLFFALMHVFLDAQRGDEDALLWLEAGIGLQETDVEVLIGG